MRTWSYIPWIAVSGLCS
nr:unnamed protein product [Callosobruchus chinensis]